ncbi:hypothetical protein JHK86_015838 [Glycine max]|nr:hypothetical protein JHK86_015838 [Glycine max]
MESLDIYPASARTGIEAFRFDKSLGILRDLLNLTYCVKEQAIARLHRITLDVLNYSEMMYHDWTQMSNSETNVAHPLNHCHKAHNKYQLQFTTSLCDRTTLVGTLSRNNLHEKAKAHEGATLSKRF